MTTEIDPLSTEIDASYDTVRPMRHTVIKLLMTAAANMRGEVGIDVAHQLSHVDEAIKLTNEAVTALAELREEVSTRDFDAYLEAKRRKEGAYGTESDEEEEDEDDQGDPAVTDLFQ